MTTDSGTYEPQPPPFPCPGWSGTHDGEQYVWVRADEDWKAGGQGRRCRAAGCLAAAVVRLNRWQDRRGKGRVPMWWHYCQEHAYSRVVHDGAVWQPRAADMEGFFP